MGFPSSTALDIDAATDSGSIVVDGLQVDGSREKRRVQGKIGGGGPRVRLKRHSGSIKLQETVR
jgi:hypothetical protein